MRELRHKIRRQRSLLSITIQQDIAIKITLTICQLPIFKASKFIAAYLPFNGEVDARPLIKNIWQEHKRCYLPVIKNDQMLFVQYVENDQLIKNHFGILEPPYSDKKIIQPEELDLVIVPLVGFDKNANRLGTGGGYYDRTFIFKKQKPNSKPYLLGIAYELQKLTSLTPNVWDVPMDMIVTEERSYP